MIHKPDKPLIKTNPHLRNSEDRQAQFITAVTTSSAVEGVVVSPSQLAKSKKTARRK